MKEAIITDLNGLFIDVELVDDNETGYLPLSAPDDPYDNEVAPITGYRVALPVTPGFYRPRFDREAYDAHQASLSSYVVAKAAWLALPEGERGPEPTAPASTAYWVEGLAPEDIAALQLTLPRPSPEQVRIRQLETDNATLLLSQAETEARLQKSEQDHAGLLLALVEGGVI
ncbi:hypothetical protein [Paenibacillus herberti]|uniref:Bacteriophage SP-beta YorD domain-containing protein n=1 Tax=Paenibacillus herberti TaxID=1619309 RepID=A0A229P009_9BACL|nr:hypothetical protein [Paenibacillus herberti]OXM15235.1 hypothetical protein CGZ75_00345 [Paenibacillus herberti]